MFTNLPSFIRRALASAFVGRGTGVDGVALEQVAYRLGVRGDSAIMTQKHAERGGGIWAKAVEGEDLRVHFRLAAGGMFEPC